MYMYIICTHTLALPFACILISTCTWLYIIHSILGDCRFPYKYSWAFSLCTTYTVCMYIDCASHTCICRVPLSHYNHYFGFPFFFVFFLSWLPSSLFLTASLPLSLPHSALSFLIPSLPPSSHSLCPSPSLLYPISTYLLSTSTSKYFSITFYFILLLH